MRLFTCTKIIWTSLHLHVMWLRKFAPDHTWSNKNTTVWVNYLTQRHLGFTCTSNISLVIIVYIQDELISAVHGNSARTHLHRPLQPFSLLHPHFSSSWQLCEACGIVIHNGSHVWPVSFTHPPLTRARGLIRWHQGLAPTVTSLVHGPLRVLKKGVSCGWNGVNLSLLSCKVVLPHFVNVCTRTGTVIHDCNISLNRHCIRDSWYWWCTAQTMEDWCNLLEHVPCFPGSFLALACKERR